jgi:hypothetical protein
MERMNNKNNNKITRRDNNIAFGESSVIGVCLETFM